MINMLIGRNCFGHNICCNIDVAYSQRAESIDSAEGEVDMTTPVSYS